MGSLVLLIAAVAQALAQDRSLAVAGSQLAPCEHNSLRQHRSLTGRIVATGGAPYVDPDGKILYRTCAFTIEPDARLEEIVFSVNTQATRFAMHDYLDFYSDARGLVGKFSATRPMMSSMTLIHSHSARLVLRSTSSITTFNISFSCTVSDDIKVFGHYFSPARFVVLAVAASLMFICIFVVIPLSFCWYRQARNGQDRALRESMVVIHAEHQRQRNVAEDVEKQVMTQLEGLPMETWQTKEAEEPENKDCCLCLEEYKADEELRVLPCKHFFHKSCVDQWFASRRFRPRSCPTCRTNPLPSAAIATPPGQASSASRSESPAGVAPSTVGAREDGQRSDGHLVVEDVDAGPPASASGEAIGGAVPLEQDAAQQVPRTPGPSTPSTSGGHAAATAEEATAEAETQAPASAVTGSQ